MSELTDRADRLEADADPTCDCLVCERLRAAAADLRKLDAVQATLRRAWRAGEVRGQLLTRLYYEATGEALDGTDG